MGYIRVGKSNVKPNSPGHVPGIRQGNTSRGASKQVGHHTDHTADARRSTGIQPKKHNPLLPIMPNLPPG
ncbi:MAG TPA: hypothetical protein VF482_22480 [Trebonia sp.]